MSSITKKLAPIEYAVRHCKTQAEKKEKLNEFIQVVSDSQFKIITSLLDVVSKRIDSVSNTPADYLDVLITGLSIMSECCKILPSYDEIDTATGTNDTNDTTSTSTPPGGNETSSPPVLQVKKFFAENENGPIVNKFSFSTILDYSNPNKKNPHAQVTVRYGYDIWRPYCDIANESRYVLGKAQNDYCVYDKQINAIICYGCNSNVNIGKNKALYVCDKIHHIPNFIAQYNDFLIVQHDNSYYIVYQLINSVYTKIHLFVKFTRYTFAIGKYLFSAEYDQHTSNIPYFTVYDIATMTPICKKFDADDYKSITNVSDNGMLLTKNGICSIDTDGLVYDVVLDNVLNTRKYITSDGVEHQDDVVVNHAANEYRIYNYK